MVQAIVHNELKIARVRPLFKADRNILINNYCPVSVLPGFVFTKKSERLMYNRLCSFIILIDINLGFKRDIIQLWH